MILHLIQKGNDDLSDLILITSIENDEFARKITNHLNHPLAKTEWTRFGDTDMKVRIAEEESVKGKNVYLIMTYYPTVADRLQELSLWTDALIRGSAERLTIVEPILLGSRQDRKTKRGEPINARVYTNILLRGTASEQASRMEFMTSDLHASQLQSLAMRFDNLDAGPLFAEYTSQNYRNIYIVSPDEGYLKSAALLVDRVGAKGLGFIGKIRSLNDGEIENYGVTAGDEIVDSTVLIPDD